MPPKDYDLLRPVYRAISKVSPGYRYDPINSMITTLNIILGNINQYSEDEILEALPKIEYYIDELPVHDSIKQILCDTLWNPRNSVIHSLELITLSLKNIKGD